ncbi:hypothetical protein [Pelosinus sp. UFO1]|uniref:hypothetical protein n=1 Tax=Pelosinus sp. UFO1 TaxID=484770 RepID=UPI0004D1B5B5|nr:hypothetical protein [Pelosinus sp. UFO1]AIF53430.1 hypothetical protein UFO1_3887 [Pelosinus sp. UFO1]
MALKVDFQNTLETFVFSNLPVLMNITNAMHVVVSDTITPTTPTNPTIPVSTPIDTTITPIPTIVITPDVLKAIQAYTLNNFPDIGLPQDIQEIAKEFLANLPPIVPVTQNTATTLNTATSTNPIISGQV